MEENGQKSVVNHFEAGSNCQVFNGNITGCTFAMPGSNVTQQAAPLTDGCGGEEQSPADAQSVVTPQVNDDELFKFIHPAITGEEERKIHEQVKKLVTRQGIQEICKYLTKLESEEKIYLPQSADSAYTELVRMGMPDGEGFSLKTFMKYYKK